MCAWCFPHGGANVVGVLTSAERLWMQRYSCSFSRLFVVLCCCCRSLPEAPKYQRHFYGCSVGFWGKWPDDKHLEGLLILSTCCTDSELPTQAPSAIPLFYVPAFRFRSMPCLFARNGKIPKRKPIQSQALDSSYRAAVASLIQRQAHSSENPTQFITTTFRPEMVAVASQCYGISHQNKVGTVRASVHGGATTS